MKSWRMTARIRAASNRSSVPLSEYVASASKTAGSPTSPSACIATCRKESVESAAIPRGIAADSTDSFRQVAIQALGEVGDPAVFEALATYSERGTDERLLAARILAVMRQDFIVGPKEQEITNNPAAFWNALAAAQKGTFTVLHERVTQMDDIGFRRLVGDEANIFYAIREFRSLSNEL